ncbi:Glutathione S-transferase protein [Aphelenchoides fujianensis]|nr:Glutathione S-transferase protein [Aphelenchoides fujianensis]
MPEHTYKITYFPARGLGEASRMVLAYAKQPFEDERIDAAELDKRRAQLPYGRLPVLTIDGKTILAESAAIARYLAKQFGLAGKDDIEAAQIDGVADVQKDISAALGPFFAVASGRAQGDKEELKKTVLLPTLEKFMPLLQKQLEASGSGFYAKSGPSWVDFFASSAVQTLKNVEPEVAAKFPFALEHLERVNNLPQLKEYLAKRPNTPF